MNFILENTLQLLLLVGIIYLITGIFVLNFPPKKINHLYGYRMTRSMKSQERWDFAQKKSSWEMIKIAIVMIFLSGIPLIIPISENQNLWLSLFLLISFTILMIYRVEKAIKNKFG